MADHRIEDEQRPRVVAGGLTEQQLAELFARVDEPAWIPCPGGCCSGWWCAFHGLHASDCDCDGVENTSRDPYYSIDRLAREYGPGG